MANTQKCLTLLEDLKQPSNGARFDEPAFSSLTKILQTRLNLPLTQLNQTPLFQQLRHPPVTDGCPSSWQCNSYLIYLLRSIVDNCTVDQTHHGLAQLLSPQHLQLILVWINLTASIHLAADLDPDMLKHSLLSASLKPNTALSVEQRSGYMSATVRAFGGFFRHSCIVLHDPLELTLIQYVSALHDLIIRLPADDPDHQLYAQMLDDIFAASPLKYTRILLIVKANKALRPEQNERLHRDMLLRLQTPHGFECLTRNILPVTALHENNVDEELLRSRSDIVAGICGRRGHTRAFYDAIRSQCEHFIEHCQRSKTDELYVTVCLDTMLKIYTLPDGGGQRQAIETFVFRCLQTLAVPGDILAGRVVLDHRDLLAGLELVRLAVCSPQRRSAYKLPSRLLIAWLPLLMRLHAYTKYIGTDHTGPLIVYCLANQSRAALGDIVDTLLLHEQHAEDDARQLHPRIRVQTHPTTGQLSCSIAPATAEPEHTAYSASVTLLDVLKQSEHNVLIYNVFLHLLEQLAVVADAAPGAAAEALPQDMAELEALMRCAFDKRIAIISTLSDLIEYKPFHAQFNENPAESLACMTGLLSRRVRQLRAWRLVGDERRDDGGDATYVVIVSIIREFVGGLVHRGVQQWPEFGSVLDEYMELTGDCDVRTHLQAIRRMLSVERGGSTQPSDPSLFEAARILCSANEPYLKVYGLTQMTKLVRGNADAEVHAMRHTILMVAMDGLKHEDSYVFLNCIRLLVALVGPLQAEVMQTMVAEFQLADADVDYRLKVCEGIVKVAEHLGPLIFAHRDILIPCFLVGCSFPNDDLRTASLSSMATVVRLLAHQVHAFFQELIDITHRIITGDTHVPCRRAAVMMLSHLIRGFDKLAEFEDVLLPVYRALKYVAEHETDGTTVIHARSGLDRLRLKVAAFLAVDQRPKEIQVFGINERQTDGRRTKSILEIL